MIKAPEGNIDAPEANGALIVPAFRLSKQVTDPEIYKLLTRLPDRAVLEKIEGLPPFIGGQIKKCFINLYSYVTERAYVEGTPTFFVHVSATVHYESATGTLIKGKDHAQKASNILQMIDKILKEIDERLASYPYNEKQIDIITNFKKLLESHQIALMEALVRLSDDKKEFIKRQQGLEIPKAQTGIVLSPQKRKAVALSYPDSPQKGQGTPKKLSAKDKETLAYLAPGPEAARNPRKDSPAKKKLLQELSDEEGVDLNVDVDEDDDLSDFLSKQIDELVFGSRIPSGQTVHQSQSARSKKKSPTKE